MNNPYADIIDLPHHISQMPWKNALHSFLPLLLYPAVTMRSMKRRRNTWIVWKSNASQMSIGRIIAMRINYSELHR